LRREDDQALVAARTDRRALFLDRIGIDAFDGSRLLWAEMPGIDYQDIAHGVRHSV
jgi:hypothetical protein